MKRQKITYEKLSELTEISISTLKDILRGKTQNPRVSTIKSISEALNIPIELMTVTVLPNEKDADLFLRTIKEVDTTYKYKRFKDATDGLTDYEIEQIFQYIDFIKFKDNKEKTD